LPSHLPASLPAYLPCGGRYRQKNQSRRRRCCYRRIIVDRLIFLAATIFLILLLLLLLPLLLLLLLLVLLLVVVLLLLLLSSLLLLCSLPSKSKCCHVFSPSERRFCCVFQTAGQQLPKHCSDSTDQAGHTYLASICGRDRLLSGEKYEALS
jgi:hypothetical protein